MALSCGRSGRRFAEGPPEPPSSTIGGMPHNDDRPELWPFLTDDELETIAPEYVWGAEMGDEAERLQFTAGFDQIVAEARRRGKPEIIDRARASLVQPENPSDRVAAREEHCSQNLKF